MKKILFMALILTSAFSMISCTADAVEAVEEETVATPAHADGEPGNTPIKPPPPTFP